jgi:hypothetical protein
MAGDSVDAVQNHVPKREPGLLLMGRTQETSISDIDY